MSENNCSGGIVEELRLKTEKSDMSQYLKSTLGGYTKASVLEYLNVLRKQQQSMAETFSKNQQILFSEKDSLKKENEALQLRLNKAESEYKNLRNSILTNELESTSESGEDNTALKNKISALEEEIAKLGTENAAIAKEMLLKELSVKDLSSKIDSFNEERISLKEMLKAEMLESNSQRSLVSKLSGIIEERESELRALHALMAESELIKQNEQISELTERLAEQNELTNKYNEEKELKIKTLDSLKEENEVLKNNIRRLADSLAEAERENNKLSYTVMTLSEKLEEEYRNTLSLIKEKSAITIEKMAVSRKLEESNSKISLFELKLQKEQGKTKDEKLIIAAGIVQQTESK